MFTKNGMNSVESDEGYSVVRKDRYELEYREDGRRVIIEVEPGDGLAVYSTTIKTWSLPNQNELITNEKKREIINRVSLALKFMEVKHVIC